MAGAAPCSPNPGCALVAALLLRSLDSAVLRATTAASPPRRPCSPARPVLTSGVLERDIYGKDTLNFP